MTKMEKIEKKPLGVIEAFSAGFELVARHPWILLVPIMLDLFLWAGPQISAKPIIDQAISSLNSFVPSDAPAETIQNIDAIKQIWNEESDSINLFGVMAIGMPSLFGVNPPTNGTMRPAGIVVNDGGTLVTMLAGLGLLGIMIASIYLCLIARSTRSEDDQADSYLFRMLKAFLDTLMLVALLAAALVILMVPVGFGAAIVSLFSPTLASFVSLAGTMLVFWAMLYLTFVLPAIFVSGANAPRAILNSISVFRFDFWSAIGLIVLTYVIRMGFVFVWQILLESTLGLAVALVASAFLGSGLIAANMVFYNDRMNWMLTVREHIRRQQSQLKG
jgi:hypothetical protein